MLKQTQNLPIFVYGTLMLGERNHIGFLQENLKSVENASVRGELFYYHDEDYPALTKGNKTIHGQLFYVDHIDEVLKKLDIIEGYIAPGSPNNMYNRQVTTVTTEAGEAKTAYVYFINPLLLAGSQKFSRIFENSWTSYRAHQKQAV